MAEMESAKQSAYLGFFCDPTGVSTQLSAISNALKEYMPGIDSGISDPSAYDDLLAKLEASGIQDVINSYQEQLDAWLAAGGNTASGSGDAAADTTTETTGETEAGAAETTAETEAE